MAAAFSSPWVPVAALALPALTTMARIASEEPGPDPNARGRADPVGRERSCGRAGTVADDQGQVKPSRGFDACLDRGGSKPSRDLERGFRIRRHANSHR